MLSAPQEGLLPSCTTPSRTLSCPVLARESVPEGPPLPGCDVWARVQSRLYDVFIPGITFWNPLEGTAGPVPTVAPRRSGQSPALGAENTQLTAPFLLLSWCPTPGWPFCSKRASSNLIVLVLSALSCSYGAPHKIGTELCKNLSRLTLPE